MAALAIYELVMIIISSWLILTIMIISFKFI